MDESVIPQEMNIQEWLRQKCKVKVGDRIYRKKKNMTIPDRMEITEVKPNGTGYLIKVRYMYHAVGPLERVFSDVIFLDEDWVIEKKGIDF